MGIRLNKNSSQRKSAEMKVTQAHEIFKHIHKIYFWTENFFRRAEQKFCGYWIRLRLNSRFCNARSGKVGSSHCYLDRRPFHEIATFDEIVYEYDKKHSQQLVYFALSRVAYFLTRYLKLYTCVDHGTYYKFRFTKLKTQ